MKVIIKYPPGIGPVVPMEMALDRIRSLVEMGNHPTIGVKFSLDFGLESGTGWFKVVDS